jgi:polyisoprenoid-binding protein YceI
MRSSLPDLGKRYCRSLRGQFGSLRGQGSYGVIYRFLSFAEEAGLSARYIRPVTAKAWTLNASDGQLLVHTGVTGRAARMGHRLTIAMNSWLATVRWSSGEPAEAELTVEVDSLRVLGGEGGLKALSGPEKTLAQSNALRVLDAGRFPQIRFHASDIGGVEGGYRLAGMLEIHGVTRECEIGLRVEDLGEAWRLTCEAAVRQSDFGIKPYSMLMGSMKVVDTVTVSFTAKAPKED